MSSNQSFLFDQDGNDSDWVEVYNNSNTTLNLENYYLSDDDDEFQKWKFPSLHLAPFSYLVVFASDKNRVDPNQELHTNFSIKAAGEKIFLSYNNTLIQTIPKIEIPRNYSLIPLLSDSTIFEITQTPTPGNPNQLKIIEELFFSHSGGMYNQPFNLQLGTLNESHTVRYTLDGSIPTNNSILYSSPLLLDQTLFSPSNIALIPYALPELNNIPQEEIPKAIIIRAAVFDNNGSIVSDVFTRSYFITSIGAKHELPILSLVVSPEDLFSYEKGIMVSGMHWDENERNWTGNYYQRGDEWEKSVYVSFYEPDGTVGFEQTAGLKTHGGNSRRLLQKGMKLYARDNYGKDEFDYKLYEDRATTSFKRLVLSPAAASWSQAGLEDFISNKAVSQLNVEWLATRPTVLYLNGEYWGLYFIEEKIDDHYISTYYEVDKDSLDIMKNWAGLVGHGNDKNYSKFLSFMQETDFSSDENYSQAQSFMDIDNFIDYQLFEIYIANLDWPMNNLSSWRPQNTDGKWRWIFYDGDAGLNNIKQTSLVDAIGINKDPNSVQYKSSVILRSLLRNEHFKTKFLVQLENLLNTSLSYNTLKPILEAAIASFRPELDNHINRFNYPTSNNTWSKGIENIEKFITNRPCELSDQVVDLFDYELDISESKCRIVKGAPEGKNIATNISLYPNPNNGQFYLTFNFPITSLVTLQAIDVLGQIKFETEVIVEAGENKLGMKLDHLDAGIYFYRIQIEEESVTVKGVISK